MQNFGSISNLSWFTGYFLPLFSSLLKIERRKKGELSSKTGLKTLFLKNRFELVLIVNFFGNLIFILLRPYGWTPHWLRYSNINPSPIYSNLFNIGWPKKPCNSQFSNMATLIQVTLLTACSPSIPTLAKTQSSHSCISGLYPFPSYKHPTKNLHYTFSSS